MALQLRQPRFPRETVLIPSTFGGAELYRDARKTSRAELTSRFPFTYSVTSIRPLVTLRKIRDDLTPYFPVFGQSFAKEPKNGRGSKTISLTSR